MKKLLAAFLKFHLLFLASFIFASVASAAPHQVVPFVGDFQQYFRSANLIFISGYDDIERQIALLEEQYQKAKIQFENDPSKEQILRAIETQIEHLKTTLRVEQQRERDQQAQEQQQQESAKQAKLRELNQQLQQLKEQQSAQQAEEEQQRQLEESAKQQKLSELNRQLDALRKQQAVQQAAEEQLRQAQAQQDEETAKKEKLAELKTKLEKLKKEQAQQQALEYQQQGQVQQNEEFVKQQKLKELRVQLEELQKKRDAQQIIEDQQQNIEQSAKQQQLSKLKQKLERLRKAQSEQQTIEGQQSQNQLNEQNARQTELQALKARLRLLQEQKAIQEVVEQQPHDIQNSEETAKQQKLQILKLKLQELVKLRDTTLAAQNNNTESAVQSSSNASAKNQKQNVWTQDPKYLGIEYIDTEDGYRIFQAKPDAAVRERALVQLRNLSPAARILVNEPRQVAQEIPDSFQDAMDEISFLPVASTVADGINATVSTGRSAYDYISGNETKAKNELSDAATSGVGLIIPGVSGGAIKTSKLLKLGSIMERIPKPIISFSQSNYSEYFGDNSAKYLASKYGTVISTIEDLSQAIKYQKISYVDVPVEIIRRKGIIYLLNSRTSKALERANIPLSDWHVIDLTDNSLANSALDMRLTDNGLSSGDVITDMFKRK